MTETEFEKSFQKSKQLIFLTAEDYSIESSVMLIVFYKLRIESGARFKFELGGQYHWNLH